MAPPAVNDTLLPEQIEPEGGVTVTLGIVPMVTFISLVLAHVPFVPVTVYVVVTVGVAITVSPVVALNPVAGLQV